MSDKKSKIMEELIWQQLLAKRTKGAIEVVTPIRSVREIAEQKLNWRTK